MLFLGDDWAEAHHDIELQDEHGQGAGPAAAAGGGGWAGAAARADRRPSRGDDEPGVGGGRDRNRPWRVGAGTGRGRVRGLRDQPACRSARYRERHSTSGAKSDPGDAHVLAEIVRTDRDHHRPVAGDSEQAEVVKTLARTHQTMIWTRQRQTNQLRSMLREFYPAALDAFGDDLAGRDALAVLADRADPRGRARADPDPGGQRAAPGRAATQPRQPSRRRSSPRCAPSSSGCPRRSPPPTAPACRSLVAVMTTMVAQIAALEAEVERCFGQHPDAEIITSQPGLGVVLGARVLAEFGDDNDRFVDAKARRNYAGTSPITKASGTRRVVLARYARNRRLADALHQQAFAALTASPGARAFYDSHRARGATHHQALRALSNRLVGILDGCLRHRTTLRRSHRLGTPPCRRRLTR